MKKVTLILVCLFTVCAGVLRADNDRPIQVNQLPQAAQQFIKQHFADKKVALAKVETELIHKGYEVAFTDGTHIDFDRKGNWEEIECKGSNVPTAIIPDKIMDYVRENYPDVTIKKIEKDYREYEVKLSNRIELSFSLSGKLTDIDM